MATHCLVCKPLVIPLSKKKKKQTSDYTQSMASRQPCLYDQATLNDDGEGVIMFIGSLHGKDDIYYGVNLTVQGKHKFNNNNGSVKKIQYFLTSNGKNGRLCKKKGLKYYKLTPKSIPSTHGQSVYIKSAQCNGTIKYIGIPPDKDSVYIGVELDQSNGDCDGTYAFNGAQYFQCEPNYGLYLPLPSPNDATAPVKPQAKSEPQTNDDEKDIAKPQPKMTTDSDGNKQFITGTEKNKVVTTIMAVNSGIESGGSQGSIKDRMSMWNKKVDKDEKAKGKTGEERIEAERIKKQAAQKKAQTMKQERAERAKELQKQENERQERAAAEKAQAERERKQKEKERKAKEAADKLKAQQKDEKAEKERLRKEAIARKEKERREQEAKAKQDKLGQERLAKEEKERKQREMMRQKEKIRKEKEALAKAEKAQKEAEERERKALAAKERIRRQKEAFEAKETARQEREQNEKQTKLDKEARLKASRERADRIRKEKAQKQKEAAAKAEQERKDKLKKEREDKAKAEKERKQKEQTTSKASGVDTGSIYTYEDDAYEDDEDMKDAADMRRKQEEEEEAELARQMMARKKRKAEEEKKKTTNNNNNNFKKKTTANTGGKGDDLQDMMAQMDAWKRTNSTSAASGFERKKVNKNTASGSTGFKLKKGRKFSNAPKPKGKYNKKDLENAMNKAFGKNVNEVTMVKLDAYEGDVPLVLYLLGNELYKTNKFGTFKLFEPQEMQKRKGNDHTCAMAWNIYSFFSQMPTPLLDSVPGEILNKALSKDVMKDVIHAMDEPYASTLCYLWDILAKVAMESETSRMGQQQLGKVFGPMVTMVTQQDMKGNRVSMNVLAASRMMAMFRRGIEWRMELQGFNFDDSDDDSD
eukprot:278508_1